MLGLRIAACSVDRRKSLARPHKRRNRRGRLLLTVVAMSLNGCGMYLHDADLEQSTAAAKESFGKLSAPAFLEAQATNLEEFGKLEDAASARLHAASRDYSLLNVIDPPETDPRRRLTESASRLAGAIRTQLWLATGREGLDQRFISAFEQEVGRRTDAINDTRFYDRRLEGRAAAYRRNKGTAVSLTCADVMAQHAPAADPDLAKQVYGQIRMVCDEIAKAKTYLQNCSLGLSGGSLFKVCAEADKSRTTLRVGNRKEEISTALAALNAALKKARKDPPSQIADIMNIAAQADDFPSPEKYAEILGAIDTLFSSDLNESLTELTSEKNRVLDTPAATATMQALQLLGAIDAAAAAQGEKSLDQPTALLIGIAKVRHDLHMVEVDLELRRSKLRLQEDQAAALRKQIHYLARAQNTLCPGFVDCRARPSALASVTRQSFARATGHYTNSFDVGLIPYEVFTSRILQAERATALRRAQLTEADYRALLQPAIDQIAAYGAGGLKPDVLAPFLANFPVTGAILGR